MSGKRFIVVPKSNFDDQTTLKGAAAEQENTHNTPIHDHVAIAAAPATLPKMSDRENGRAEIKEGSCREARSGRTEQ